MELDGKRVGGASVTKLFEASVPQEPAGGNPTASPRGGRLLGLPAAGGPLEMLACSGATAAKRLRRSAAA